MQEGSALVSYKWCMEKQLPDNYQDMGNIYYEQKKYPNAIKMYRMALDQIPSTTKGLR